MHLKVVGLVAACLYLVGCGANETRQTKPDTPTNPFAHSGFNNKPPLYNRREKNIMTLCIAMSDRAHAIALQKKQGTPKQRVKEYYAGKSQEKLTMAMIDKVYATEIKSIYSYSVGFFIECADNLARVNRKRSRMASYCMQNQLIADYAYRFNHSGKSKQYTYNYFSKFKAATVNKVIDFAYASPLDRAKLKLQIWDACMKPLSKQ